MRALLDTVMQALPQVNADSGVSNTKECFCLLVLCIKMGKDLCLLMNILIAMLIHVTACIS